MQPFAENPDDRIDRIGEKRLLSFIREWLGAACPPAPRGIGDDAAVLPRPDRPHLLLTNDGLVWGRHFDATASASAAGAKLLKRSLSDIAAMGGRPLQAVLAIAAGGDLSRRWLGGFFAGLAECARAHGCEINGGDLSGADSGTFAANLTLLGDCGRPVPRKGGAPGSWIWATGSLGGSILGHHLTFEPRLAEGAWLAADGGASALMDLTDGLALDLPEMIPDGLRARIDLAFVPVSDAARAAAQDTGRPAVWHAFTDGEDYELAFFTPPETDPVAFESAWKRRFATPLAPIGTLERAPRPDGPAPAKVVGLDGRELFGRDGFEHFR
ncbi:MAG: thiamine-phosphate kinase [Puniceicoccaceae bacterium]